MKILLYGGGGFIGRNLAEFLLKQKCIVTIADIGFSLPASFDELSKDINFICVGGGNLLDEEHISQFDVCFYLAGCSTPGVSLGRVSSEMVNNIFPLVGVLEVVKNTKCRFVYISSGGAVYGEGEMRVPLKEEDDVLPLSDYGVSKVMAETVVCYFARRYGFNYAIIRLSNPYGPWQFSNSGYGLIPSVINSLCAGDKINILGDGTAVRDFIFIRDVVKILFLIGKTREFEGIINVGTGLGLSLLEVVQTCENVLGKKADLFFSPWKEGFVKLNILSIKRLQNHFEVSDFIGLEDGVKLTYEWCKGCCANLGAYKKRR